MVSALPLCLLLLAVSSASSQFFSEETEAPNSVAERRTFKPKKPIKFLPLFKKHKKFAGWVPNPYRTEYAEVPIIHESPRPIYKFHRYQGIEVKPVSTPEPIIESHSVVHSSDIEPTYSSDHSYSAIDSLPSNFVVYPSHDKPIFKEPAPIFSAPEVHVTPKPFFSFIPAPPPQFSPPIQFALPPAPLPSISFARPAISHVITSQLPPQLPPPAFTSVAVPVQAPVVQHIPAPSPAPVLPHFPTPSPAPIFSTISFPTPAPAPVLPVKIPAPALPSVPAPSPLPILPPISVTPSPPAPIFPSFPPAVTFPALPTPAPTLSVSAAPEPEYPYPPSGTPIPSYIKDVSFPVTEPTPTSVVTPNYDAAHDDEGTKHVEAIKADPGLLQKLKDWKAEKANAALSHFTHFKHKPLAFAHTPVTVTTVAPPHLPSHPSLQFPGPIRPFPLTPDFRPPAVFLPPQFLPPVKYENFPPNHIEPPQLFNSYGAPIPHDTYAAPHESHDRLSPEASEEEPSILPPPAAFGEQKQEQTLTEQTESTKQPQIQLQTNKNQFQPKNLLPKEHPIYVPEDNQTKKDEVKTIEIVLPINNSQVEDNLETQEKEDPNLQNHKQE